MASQFFVQGEKISIKANGTWMADGVEITHEQTRDTFSKVVHWRTPGFQGPETYYLTIGYETIAIEAEDTPFFVTSVDFQARRWIAALSDGSTVEIAPNDLSYRDWSLYLNIKNSHAKRVKPDYPWARFLSSPYYALLSRLEEDQSCYYIPFPEKNRAVLLEKALLPQ